MNSAIDKLAKYIELECQRGYDNKAVMGGLDRILDPWRSDAEASSLDPDVIEAVMARLRDYPGLSPASRGEALRGLWTRLSKEEVDLGPFPGSAPSETSPEAEASSPGHPKEIASEPQDDPEAEPETPEASGSKPTRPPRAPKQIEDSDGVPAAMTAPLTTIAGIGPKSAKTLRKLGLETLGDLLWHLPRRYDDYSQLKTINRLWYGEDVTIIASVDQIKVRPVRGGKMKLVEAVVTDGTGSLRVTWFNQPWIATKLKPGQAIVLSSKVDQYLGHLTMSSPEWELLEREQLHTNRIVPVYPLTAGITSKWMRKVMHSVVLRLAPRLPDPMPASVLESANMMGLGDALIQVHFPEDQSTLAQAQKRLAFDEMFLLQFGVLRQKQSWERLKARPMAVGDDWVAQFSDGLPFELTQAQTRAMEDIRTDMAEPHPMNRLLEGDVGSGKTAIAAASIGMAAANGSQSALMAPTSILAEQHHKTLSDILPAAAGVPSDRIRLITGATPDSERQAIRQGLKDGSIQVIVGTHALLEDPIEFSDLGLAIIDEQHRFGVEQRATLRGKGEAPNLLVMTATPIPRSLALTIYGDLELSVIDEMPPGRIPVETRVLSPLERSRAYNFIIGQLEAGRQAFVIYPLVEESEKVEAKAATEEFESLQKKVFFNFRVGLLHGKLPQEEKDSVMEAFRQGDYDVLVSTSVVEVGVDVPNTSVVLIEGANRFGLSQLHQFRGRVGRSQHASYCMLIPDTEAETDNERLRAMESTSDGFELAELDLAQRGPGDFFGTRQSGMEPLRTANLTDVKLIEVARREAKGLFQADPELIQPAHRGLAEAVDRFWSGGKGDIS
jgi:ATP-dependent DNA helicase RecG